MAEQALDLQSALSTLRRRRGVLAVAALLGVVGGVGLLLAFPPMYSSTSQVLLPPPRDSSGQASTRDAKTEVSIAESDLVLGSAARQVQPPVSPRELRRKVDVVAKTTDVIQITARADSADLARRISQEVAEAEVAYVQMATSSLTNAEQAALVERTEALQQSLDTIAAEIKKTTARVDKEDPNSVAGKTDAAALAQLTAQQGSLVLQLDDVKSQMANASLESPARILQNATSGRRPSAVTQVALSAIRGLAAAVLLAVIAVLVIARRDRRLRYRDEIADALGSPVIASVRSRVPRSVAGWVALLADYDPGTVDGWALRQCLRQLAPLNNGKHTLEADVHEPRLPHPRSIIVVALADDEQGLALGPQLASYAASAGISTTLLMAQRHESAAALWAAAAQVTGSHYEVRPGLRVAVEESGESTKSALTVRIVVVDRRRPVLPDLPKASSAVISIAAGAATAEELARVAVTADDVGSRITAILVADPDNLDRTTGRLLQRERAHQVPLPARMTGLSGNVSALRRKQP